MHVFEAAIYFVYYFILLLGIMTEPTNNLRCQGRVHVKNWSPSKTPNTHKHIVYGIFENNTYKRSPFWVPYMI